MILLRYREGGTSKGDCLQYIYNMEEKNNFMLHASLTPEEIAREEGLVDLHYQEGNKQR